MNNNLGYQNSSHLSIFKSYSVLILLITNFVPILGVVFLGWDIFSIILLYLTEYFIIGFFSALKIITLISSFVNFANSPLPIKIFFCGWFALFICIFLAILWGFFSLPFAWLLLFLKPNFIDNNLLITLKETFIGTGLGLAVIGILFSHSFSFYYNFVTKKEITIWINNVSKSLIMMMVRILFIYPVIFTGGLVALFFGNLPLLLAFILYKTLIDAIIHIKEHNLATAQAKNLTFT